MYLTGLRAAITRQVNDYARKQGYRKANELNFTGEDTRQGLTAIVSIKVVEPQFEGQNKLKLLNNEVRYHVESAVAEAMGRWMEENPRDARQGRDRRYAQPPLYRVTATRNVNGRNRRSSQYVYDDKGLEDLRKELGVEDVRLASATKGWAR